MMHQIIEKGSYANFIVMIALSYLLAGWGLWTLLFRPFSGLELYTYFAKIGGEQFHGTVTLLFGLAAIYGMQERIHRMSLSIPALCGGWCYIFGLFFVDVIFRGVPQHGFRAFHTGIYVYGLFFLASIVCSLQFSRNAEEEEEARE